MRHEALKEGVLRPQKKEFESSNGGGSNISRGVFKSNELLEQKSAVGNYSNNFVYLALTLNILNFLYESPAGLSYKTFGFIRNFRLFNIFSNALLTKEHSEDQAILNPDLSYFSNTDLITSGKIVT